LPRFQIAVIHNPEHGSSISRVSVPSFIISLYLSLCINTFFFLPPFLSWTSQDRKPRTANPEPQNRISQMNHVPTYLRQGFQHRPMRRPFTPVEDALLSQIMTEQPFTTWLRVANQMPGRTARQCRDRWANYISPHNRNAPWTPEEDSLLLMKFFELGPHWASIAKHFDGRSENNVKNRWYTYIRLTADPETGRVSAKGPVVLSQSGKMPLPPISSFDDHWMDAIPVCQVVAPRQ
jgi:hypothetical protein